MGSNLQPTLQMVIEWRLCCTAQKYDLPLGRKWLGERYYWMYGLQNTAPSGYWHNGLAEDATEQESGPGKRRDRNVYFGWENQCQTINRNIPHWPMLLYSTRDGTRATPSNSRFTDSWIIEKSTDWCLRKFMGVLNYDVANTLAKTRRPRLVHLVHWAYAASYKEKPEH